MDRPFEGKCMHCIVDKQGCTFEPSNLTQCTWCIRHRYRCSETELDSRRRKLSGFKCEQCREKHHKCLPENRVWPDRCNFCKERNLPCSPPRSRRTKNASTSSRRGISPAGSLHPAADDHEGSHSPEPGPLEGPSSHTLDSDLQSSVLGMVGSMDIDGRSAEQTSHGQFIPSPHHPHDQPLMQLSPVPYTQPYLQPMIAFVEPQMTPRPDLSPAMKRRLFNFLYAAEQPLTLAEFCLISAINTHTQTFELENMLQLVPGTPALQLQLNNWYGPGVIQYRFSPTGGFLEITEGCLERLHALLQYPHQRISGFGDFFLSSEDAHAETLLVCATYLSLSDGGASGKNKLSGRGFLYTDDNDLSQIMKLIEKPPIQGPFDPNREVPPVPPFYALWTYATLNWARHLARITPPLHNIGPKRASPMITLAALRICPFILSSHCLTWLENLSNVLNVGNSHDSEHVALALAHMFGVLQRWLQTRIDIDSLQDVKLYARALHWSNSLQALDILGQIQHIKDMHSTAFGGSGTASRRKMELCQILQAKITLPAHETMTLHDCKLISHNKLDLDSYKQVVANMAAGKEPCVYDPSRRVVYYVNQKCWSGGALQIECVDLETGLIIGKDWTWTKRFVGWRHRILIAKSSYHLALQVVAERTVDHNIQRLLLTYVVQVKDLERCRLGENVLSGGWLVDDEIYNFGPNISGTKLLGLSEAGYLVFSPDGRSLQTPRGVWDLNTRGKISECTVNPTLIAVSLSGTYRVHAELDAYHNVYTSLCIKDNQAGTSQQILGYGHAPTGRNVLLAPAETPQSFTCRYVGFSHCGTKFVVQLDYHDRFGQGQGRQLGWFVWERKGDIWELRRRFFCDESEFWPLMKVDPFSDGNEVHILWNMGSICSVHQDVPAQDV